MQGLRSTSALLWAPEKAWVGDFVAFMSIHRANAERCTCPTYGTYAMCEAVLLWHIVKALGFKVPTQYSWELIAQRPFKLAHVERLVTTQAEPPRKPARRA